MFNLGPLEVVAILVVALVVFGPNKLPEIGRQVGRAVREIRRFQNTFQDEVKGAFDLSDVAPNWSSGPSKGSGTNGATPVDTDRSAAPRVDLAKTEAPGVPTDPAAPADSAGAAAPDRAHEPMPGQTSLFGDIEPSGGETGASPDEPSPR